MSILRDVKLFSRYRYCIALDNESKISKERLEKLRTLILTIIDINEHICLPAVILVAELKI